MVQAQEAYTKEKYSKASRIGRGLRLDRIKRMKVWGVFEEYMCLCDERKLRDSEFAMYECRIILEKQFSVGRYESIIQSAGSMCAAGQENFASITGRQKRSGSMLLGF